mgnify:CR=1 FL=1
MLLLKIFIKNELEVQKLLFKFSHLLSFRIPSFLNITYLKNNKFLIYGFDFNKVTQMLFAIKKLHNNLYTGKGIIKKIFFLLKKFKIIC